MGGGLRGKRLRDMAISLAVLLLPVLAIMWMFTRTPAAVAPTPSGVPQAIQAARAGAPYPVLAPEGLPAGWAPQRVRYTRQGEPDIGGSPSVGNEWLLAYLSPDKVSIAVRQRDAAPEQFIAAVTRDGRPDGSVDVAGRPWQRYVSADGRQRALVSRGEQATTIVTGDTGYEPLQQFAAALR